MIEENEVKARTVWSKFLHYEETTDNIFGEQWYAKIECIREVSGYAVWYRRHLKNELSERSGAANGSYLLRFYALGARDDAIEFAVLAATKGPDNDVTLLQSLDAMAVACPSIRSAGHD